MSGDYGVISDLNITRRCRPVRGGLNVSSRCHQNREAETGKVR